MNMENNKEKLLGHGDHFNTILSDEKMRGILLDLSKSPKVIKNDDDGRLAVVISYDKPIQVIGILKIAQKESEIGEILSGYPLFNISNRLHVTIDKIFSDDEFGEGYIEGTSRFGISVNFLDTLFCFNKTKYEIGKEYTFNLSAIVYELEKRTDQLEFVPKQGPFKGEKITTHQMTGFDTHSNKYHGDFTFATPYRNFRQEISFMGEVFVIFDYIQNATPAELEQEEFRIPMLVRKKRLENIDMEDPITGSAWLQGYLVDDSLDLQL